MGLPLSTSRSMWLWRDSAPTVSSPAEGFGVLVLVLVLVLEFGFGVHISKLRLRFRKNSVPMLSSPAGWLQRQAVLCFGSQELMSGSSSARSCVSGGKD